MSWRGITRMKKPVHGFAEGDRVRAPRRPQFPRGTVVKLMDEGFLLVRWDGDVLETAHYSELEKASDVRLAGKVTPFDGVVERALAASTRD